MAPFGLKALVLYVVTDGYEWLFDKTSTGDFKQLGNLTH